MPLLAIGCRAGCSGERRTSSFNGIERSLSRAVVIKTKSLSVSATTFPTALSLKSRTMGESISTIQRCPRLSTSYKFTAPRYRLLPMAFQTVQVSVEPRLSTTLIDRSVAPYSQRLSFCPSPLPRFQQRCLESRRDACERISAIQAVLKGRTGAIRKGNKHQLGLFFLLEACQRNAAGWSTAADQRTQSFLLPIVIHQSLDPAVRALKRQSSFSPCLYMHSSTRQAQNASTHRVYAPSR